MKMMWLANHGLRFGWEIVLFELRLPKLMNETQQLPFLKLKQILPCPQFSNQQASRIIFLCSYMHFGKSELVYMSKDSSVIHETFVFQSHHYSFVWFLGFSPWPTFHFAHSGCFIVCSGYLAFISVTRKVTLSFSFSRFLWRFMQ